MDLSTMIQLSNAATKLSKSFERIADALQRLADNDDKRVKWLEAEEKDTEPQR